MPILAPITTPITARLIIENALRFGLNRLSPGESLDTDTAEVCLRALNHIADEWNGKKAFLFQEILSASVAPISAATALLGYDWLDIAAGDQILGATVDYGSDLDVPLAPITMEQYHEAIAVKTTATYPSLFAHDGLSTLYFYPVPTGQTITLRTRRALDQFVDLDSPHEVPVGYSSALSACLADALAPTMNPELLPVLTRRASAARQRIGLQVVNPAIVDAAGGYGGKSLIERGY